MVEQSPAINAKALHEYAHHFAKKTAEYFFIDHQVIYGKEILNFCDIKQVNLFIIKILFNRWQQETQRLRSPYFDFKAQEVQRALQMFMNVLSRHILVSKNDFQPLVAQACKDALLLLLQPYQFFKYDFNQNPQDYIDKQNLKNTIKYVQFNKELLKSYAQQIEPYNTLDKAEAWQIFEETYRLHKESLEPIEWRIRSFSDIALLSLEDFYEPEPVIDGNVFVYESYYTEQYEKYAETTWLGNIANNNAPLTEESPPEDHFLLYASQHTETMPENEKPALNIADKFKKMKIETIRGAISLNQKFIFINQLFGGNNLAFNEAVDRIEQCQHFEEARNLINADYAIRFQWDYQTTEPHKFLELVERRFI